MTRAPARAARLLIGAALVTASLSGCAAGPSNQQLEQQLESTANTLIPGLNGAFVSLSYEGSDRSILLVLYTKSSDQAVVAHDIDEGFRVMWKNSPFRPSSVAVGAAARARPTHPVTVEPDSVDPRPIATALGIAQKYTTSTWIDIPDPVLVTRYGERKQSSGS